MAKVGLKKNNIPKSCSKIKFKVIIEQDDDGYFVVECPTLPGCISQGKTLEEAKENIKEAIECYLESLKKHGEPMPLPVYEETVEVTI